MVHALVNTGRSLRGCWTCRLRKKKCDEIHPSCSNCSSLGLHCQGYGRRPEWMDQGPLQKQQAVRVKLIVRHTRSKQKLQRLWYAASLTQYEKLKQDPLLVKMGWKESFHDIALPAELIFDQEDCITSVNRPGIDTAVFISNDSVEDDFMPSQAHQIAASPIPILTGLIKSEFGGNKSSVCGEDKSCPRVEASITSHQLKLDVTYRDTQFSGVLASTNQTESESILQPVPSLSSDAILCNSPSPVAANAPVVRSDVEDTLLTHYRDHVFNLQYPFYGISDGPSKLWLFSILRRVESAYYATLALSQYHQDSTLSQNCSTPYVVDPSKTMIRHYTLALREIQLRVADSHTWSGILGLIRGVETLAGILQLLFFEIFTGGTKNWQLHMSTAACWIPFIAQQHMTFMVRCSTDLRRGSRLQDEDILLPGNDTVIKFLLGSLVSFDIIASASTRSDQFFHLDHKLVLERAGIRLEDLFGCSNWAMILIFEISWLDQWKKDAKKANKLSISELTKRGRKLEQRLQEKLANMEHFSSTGSSLVRPPGMMHLPPAIEMTKVYALSAVTYLHVVVAGARPELPEIIESVSRTVVAFQNLTDARLLRNLVWPFCISGCLASEGQYEYFRELVSSVGVTQSAMRTCLEALRLMEACWEGRKDCSDNFDWASIMNKRGSHVLLM